MRANLDALALVLTTRFAKPETKLETKPATPSGLVYEVFGRAVAEASRPTAWTTVHGDLHWANVLGPDFGLLDWEFWGCGPVGFDAATLYLFSLLAPSANAQAREAFRDALDDPHGRRAQIAVAARILMRAKGGDYERLAPVVRREIRPILDAL